jgi:DUF4097 and DUF4098 domain-containing protein YvlB
MSNGRPRGSFVGSVLLIVIGALFLIHNFHPELISWRWIGYWWPVLLIVLGLVRLIENLALRRGGRFLTGGEFFLLVLVILIGIGASFWGRIAPHIDINPEEDIPFGESADVTDELPAHDLKPGAVVTINTPRGDISVDGSPDAKQLRIVVRKTAFAMSEEEAHKRASDARVDVRDTPQGVNVDAAVTARSSGNVRVSLEVHLPENVSLDLRTSRGDVRINDVKGSVAVSVARGDVEIRDTGGDVRTDLGRGDVRVATTKGNVHVSGKGSQIEVSDVAGTATIEGEFYGPITARSVAKGARFISERTDLTIGELAGRMTIESGDLNIENAAGPVLLTTKEKDISIENVKGRIRVQNKRGDVSVRLSSPPQEEIDLSNESGGVSLALPSRSGFELSAMSRSGEIDNDFDSSGLKSTKTEKGDAQLNGKVGAKGPQITLNTSYGSIRLKRSD